MHECIDIILPFLLFFRIYIFNFYSFWNLLISLREDGLNSPLTASKHNHNYYFHYIGGQNTQKLCRENKTCNTKRHTMQTGPDINSRKMTMYYAFCKAYWIIKIIIKMILKHLCSKSGNFLNISIRSRLNEDILMVLKA